MAAVDVQDSWLEVSVWGMGEGEQMWLIWHQKVDGDPAQDHVWEQVDQIRRTPFPHESGGKLTVRMMGVDTGGHYTQEAYEFCRRHAKDGVVALKGSSQRAAAAISRGNKVDVNWKGRVVKGGVTLYMVGTDALKRTIYARLRNNTPGPGYVNFGQNATPEYLEGLTCERLMPRYVKGFQVLEWQKPSQARNEPLDLCVYSLAVLELLKRRYNRLTFWQQMADQLQGPERKVRQPAPSRSSSGGSFVSSW